MLGIKQKMNYRVNIYTFYYIYTVSKTTSELVLNWDEDKRHEEPVTVAKDLRMPQFEMQKITTNRCHERNHMGKKVLLEIYKKISFGLPCMSNTKFQSAFNLL